MTTKIDETMARRARQAGAELAENYARRGHHDDSRMDPNDAVVDATTTVAGPCPWATATESSAVVSSEVWDAARDEVSAALHARWGELRRQKANTERLTVEHEAGGWRHYVGHVAINCGQGIELATLAGGFISGRYEMQHVEDGPPRPMFHMGLAGGAELAVPIPANAELRVRG